MIDGADINHFATIWLQAKEAERLAVESRRKAEDDFLNSVKLNINQDKIENITDGVHKIKITTRLTRKVDSDLVQEIAQEYGLTEYLHTLFRWKPEIDLKAWRSIDESTQNKLAPAITVSAGRPSFTITKD